MNVNALRSTLKYSCSEELSGLTTVDLQECKWTTKERVFLAILAQSECLRDEYNEILDIIDSHQAKINEINHITRMGDNKINDAVKNGTR